MNELTMVLFIMALGLYILTILYHRREFAWITVFVSVISIAETVSDRTLLDNEIVLLVVITFYIMLMSGYKSMVNEGK